MTVHRARVTALATGCCLAYVACIVTPSATLAAADATADAPRHLQARPQTFDGGREPRPFRIPLKLAIEACEGRNEGDPCAFRSPQGILVGLCRSGNGNLFACRPHRNVSAPEAVQTSIPQSSPPPAAPRPETAPPQKTEIMPDRPAPTPQPVSENSQQPQQTSAPQAAPEHQAAPTSSVNPPAKPEQSGGTVLPFIVGAVAAALLTWQCFFRQYSVPLRRLRKVTQQLARGDLSARIGEGLLQRKSDVAELGRDVDRMAERIESLVNAHQRLIRDVSHELRSPLARLNVALELARQSAGPTLAAPFDRIERESDRLNELISQLLMLTKLENESGTIQRAELDIAALLAEIAQDVDFEVSSKERRVRTTASEPLLLNGNRELLRQALENLVRNAARYTAQNTTVEISLRKRESGGCRWAHIEVRDQGPGVPESELYDIFRPFYRVNDARERQSGGSGVGLAISDRAVRLHGGSLRAFNAPGGGLILEMELPLA